MKTNALFAAVLAGYAFGLPLDAAALTVTRGPYLQLGTQSSIVVRWRTDTATNSRVRYGTNPSNLSSIGDDATSTAEHVVKLTGLSPNTKYYYSIGHSAATIAGDTNHFFVTAPGLGTERPTHIWVLGNSGTANAEARAVRDGYLKYKGNQYTDLWLMLGDNAYQDGTDSDYQDAVFNSYPTLLRQTTLWPTLGHRDGVTADSASQSGAYYDVFTLPKQGEAGGLASGTEAYYSFDYGNIHFVVLDSVESSRAPAGAMLTWLKNDLAATTQPWIIAYWHHPPYSKGFHDSDSDTETPPREMRKNVLPILEDGGVDLVLSGHSGSYERSFLIDGHYGSSGTFKSQTMLVDGGDGSIDGNGAYQKLVTDKPIRGTVYTVLGSSGETRPGSLDHPVMRVSLETLGSMVLNVNGPLLDATFLDDAGQVRDRFRIAKTGGTVSDPAGNLSSGSSVASATKTQSGGGTVLSITADKIPSTLKIDGNLSESSWNLAANVTKSVIGTGNNTTTFDVLRDNTYLYVGAKVLDATLKNDSANIWDDDSVEIYVDANHSHSTAYDATDFQFVKGYNDTALSVTGGNTSGILHKQAAVPGGYAIELAIPWTKLGITPTTNLTIGFDVGVNDDDNGSGRDGQMMWNGTVNNYQDTSAFGHTVLAASSSSDTSPPSRPTNLTARAVSSSQINLSWNGSTDNAGVLGYKVYRGGTQITTVTGTSYQNTGLSSSTTYTYTVAAYDAAGNISAQASSASATTQGVLPTTSLSITSYGATGNDTTDDTTAINNTINAAKAQGKSVYVPAGTFYHRTFTLDGVSMAGAGNTTAILYGFDANNPMIEVKGSGVTLSNFQKKSAMTSRTAIDWPIFIDHASSFTIDGVIVDGGNSGGIMNYGGSNGKIIRSTVKNTLADAIHNTEGAHDIIIANNTVRNPADDMIAMVTYANPAVRNILVQDNDVCSSTHGRGITSISSSDITIQGNKICDTKAGDAGSGILIATEQAFSAETVPLSNILIRNNTLTNNGGGHSAFLISGFRGNIDKIHFEGNTITNPNSQSIRLEGDNSNTKLINNTMSDPEGRGVTILSGSNVSCTGNKLNGGATSHSKCTGANNLTVTGSSLTY